jgi:hypothetical protein
LKKRSNYQGYGRLQPVDSLIKDFITSKVIPSHYSRTEHAEHVIKESYDKSKQSSESIERVKKRVRDYNLRFKLNYVIAKAEGRQSKQKQTFYSIPPLDFTPAESFAQSRSRLAFFRP